MHVSLLHEDALLLFFLLLLLSLAEHDQLLLVVLVSQHLLHDRIFQSIQITRVILLNFGLEIFKLSTNIREDAS